tara:strand:- start:3188 stop:4321 length:1134 start_codon:yes stop_codon:yes gene_type:complete
MVYKVAVIPGDGVGKEVLNEGIKIIDKISEIDEFKVEWVEFPHGAEHYLETKELMDEKTLKEIKSKCNAIYFGTFGDPNVDPGVLETGIILNTKLFFDQYVNLRPIKLFPGIDCPVMNKSHEDIDFSIIRENTEDFYVGLSGKAKNGRNKQQHNVVKNLYKVKFGVDVETKGSEIAYQIGLLSKKGCERILKFAFDYAKAKNKSLVTAVDKANNMEFYSLWRETADKIEKDYDEINCEYGFVDFVVTQLLRAPERYQVLVAPNMFGDIITDLGTVVQGGLGLSAGANINPEGISMFQPVHGSAPKFKDKKIVNPIASIRAASMMLENLGEQKSADLIMKAIESVLKGGRTRTQDIGGHNTTSEMGDAIKDKMVDLHD